MGGLRKHLPITRITFLVSCLAITGIFPFSGFFSKDEILGGAFDVHPPGWPVWYGKFLWAGLLIAALGTAFYMWRLYFMVFSGDERSNEAKKSHESPISMTGPLVVLATFATIVGFIGLPHLTAHLPSFTHALALWLEPSVVDHFFDPATHDPSIAAHLPDTTTFTLMGVALVVALCGIGIAWLFYGKGPTPTLEKLVDGPLQPAYQASKHKLWVDEIYDAAIVRPFKWLARGLFEIVDRFIIDTVAVTGVAFVIGIGSRISRWFQNGSVQRYLAGLVIGAAAVFFVTDCKTKHTFEYVRKGEMLELHANAGVGVVGNNSKLSWDIDGDGNADVDPQTGKPLTGPDITVRAADVTASAVTLIIADPVTRKVYRVSRDIELPLTETETGGSGSATPGEGK
jgi:NADH-quinone oxidoreductase subunit L